MTEEIKKETKKVTKKTTKKKEEKKSTPLVIATGRRKESIARVRLFNGSGKWNINGKSLNEYFPNKVHRQIINTPFVTVNKTDEFDVWVRVNSGGISGQAGAIRHGLSRALNDYDREAFRFNLKTKGLLTRDYRCVERKKAGLKKARKAPQFSKR